MKKLSLIWISLLAVFTFVGCSDDNEVEYNQSSDVTVAVPEVTASTGTSLTVASSVTGNTGSIVRRGFCYSANSQAPTVNDNMVEADENFSATISGLMGKEATTESQPIDEQLANYVAPAYEDNYTSIADWTNRSRWNLSNVHDPSVVLAEDGYYYMYQTDASYGNAHMAGGHFHGRRSQNLVSRN